MTDPRLGHPVLEADSARAELARSTLEGHGVHAWVSGGLELWGPQPVQVLVAPADAAAAEDVLRAAGLLAKRA
jgi:hypothetical protein